MTTRDRPAGRGGPDDVPLSLPHIVVDAHDLPAPALFRAEVPGRRILSEREREVVIGPDETAPSGRPLGEARGGGCP